MLKKFCTYIGLLLCNMVSAQQDVLIHSLLQDIAVQQVQSTNDKDFLKGLFPSFRECGGAPHNYSADNNIFFTSIAAFALQNMQSGLPMSDQKMVDSILKNVRLAYPYYQNKYGDPYYGFWPTDAPIMPHTIVFKYLKSVFGQGEDADDSVMILMSDSSNKAKAEQLKKRLVQLANGSPGRSIHSVPKAYNKYAAYSTYLGSQMPVDFDFGVQCNLLYFVFKNQLTLTQQDSATIDLLAQMVHEKLYLKSPVFISPYYVKSSILIYHISRLMGAFTIAKLEQYKQQLIADARAELQHTTNLMDKIILSTSLMRLGTAAPEIELYDIKEFEKSNQQNFIFFQARAAFPYPVLLKKVFLHWSYICYYFYCPAYNKILWLEYLVEKRRRME